MATVPAGRTSVTLLDAAHELSGEPDQKQVLDSVVRLAPELVPAAQHASVTTRGATGWATPAASGPVARELDALQYSLDEGPCLVAARTGETVLVPDLRTEGRWPALASHALRRDDVRSMLAVPLRVGRVTASLNLSSPEVSAFATAPPRDALAFAGIAVLALAAAVERERAARLATRVDQLEDFTAALGHDLRSGVNVALAAAEVLGRRSGQLDRTAQQSLRLLEAEVRDQMQLLVDLLDLAHAREVPTEPVALVPVVRDTLRQHRRPVQLSVRPEAQAALVGMRPLRLRQIVGNLLDNADRYAGGASAVRVGRTSSHTWLAVEDSGPGVPPGQREYVFRRFRTDSSTPPGDGPGLGLALSREHARSSGGDLLVEDRNGGGARFLLLLPTLSPGDHRELQVD
jgi:signal transduction histidine kinase